MVSYQVFEVASRIIRWIRYSWSWTHTHQTLIHFRVHTKTPDSYLVRVGIHTLSIFRDLIPQFPETFRLRSCPIVLYRFVLFLVCSIPGSQLLFGPVRDQSAQDYRYLQYMVMDINSATKLPCFPSSLHHLQFWVEDNYFFL